MKAAALKTVALGLLSLAAACATTGETQTAPAARPVAKAAAPAKPVFRQADILGRDAKSLDALLGAPALVRTEGAGEFRRYALAECSLIVILYTNDKGEFSAGHLDAAAKSASAGKPDLDLCLARGLPAKAG